MKGIKCIPPTLIPRPETEELVDLVISQTAKPPRRILDIGTGSGCILISLLKHWSYAEGVAIDCEARACELARENSSKFGVDGRMRVVNADIGKLGRTEGTFDLIVSNPPYIPSPDIDHLEPELRHEDPMALDGGDDGLRVINLILSQFDNLKSNASATLFMEVDSSHPELLQDTAHPPQHIHLDLAGKKRFVVY